MITVYCTSHYPVRKLRHREMPSLRWQQDEPKKAQDRETKSGHRKEGKVTRSTVGHGALEESSIRRRSHRQTDGTGSLSWLVHVGHPGTSWPLRGLLQAVQYQARGQEERNCSYSQCFLVPSMKSSM